MDIVTPEIVGLSSARLARLDSVMQQRVDAGRIAGGVTVLARRGHVAHLGCYGHMDLAAGTPMRPDAIFRIFSMTKAITSLAVLMLHEEGHFHLVTPVAEFIPAFKELRVQDGDRLAPLERPVTVYDLLTHTSGLGYGIDSSSPVNIQFQKAAMLRMDETLAEKVARLPLIPLQHQPGRCYSYSIATDVLGHLVELVSGMPLDAFLRSRVLGPLGMADTDFYVPPEKRDHLAVMYTPGETAGLQGGLLDVGAVAGDPTQVPFGLWTDKSQKPQFLSGGGGLVSTAADYLRFGMMLRGKGQLDGTRLVSRKTVELMTAPQLGPEKFFTPGFSCGLGVSVMTDPARAQMAGSAGAIGASGAANTEWWYDPTEDLMGILMIQYIAYTPCTVPLDFRAMAMQAIAD